MPPSERSVADKTDALQVAGHLRRGSRPISAAELLLGGRFAIRVHIEHRAVEIDLRFALLDALDQLPESPRDLIGGEIRLHVDGFFGICHPLKLAERTFDVANRRR